MQTKHAVLLHRGVVDEAGTSIALFAVVLAAIALGIADLIRVVDDDSTTTSTWQKRATSCRDRIASVVPLTSVKIVLVAWQIVTQVSEGTYIGWLSLPGPPFLVENLNLRFGQRHVCTAVDWCVTN